MGNKDKSNKNRKYNRNRDSAGNKAYKIQNRRMKNKKRKLLKHIKRFPKDAQAAGAVVRIHKAETDRLKGLTKE